MSFGIFDNGNDATIRIVGNSTSGTIHVWDVKNGGGDGDNFDTDRNSGSSSIGTTQTKKSILPENNALKSVVKIRKKPSDLAMRGGEVKVDFVDRRHVVVTSAGGVMRQFRLNEVLSCEDDFKEIRMDDFNFLI